MSEHAHPSLARDRDLVIAGTLDEARALARRRLLDRMSHVGLALMVTGAPCVVIALLQLFAA